MIMDYLSRLELYSCKNKIKLPKQKDNNKKSIGIKRITQNFRPFCPIITHSIIPIFL